MEDRGFYRCYRLSHQIERILFSPNTRFVGVQGPTTVTSCSYITVTVVYSRLTIVEASKRGLLLEAMSIRCNTDITGNVVSDFRHIPVRPPHTTPTRVRVVHSERFLRLVDIQHTPCVCT